MNNEILVEHEGKSYRVVARRSGTLGLEEVVPVEPPPCTVCGRPRSEWASIFRNDTECCVDCKKAVA